MLKIFFSKFCFNFSFKKKDLRSLAFNGKRDRKSVQETESSKLSNYDLVIKQLKSTKVSNKLFLLEGKTLIKDAMKSENVKLRRVFYVEEKMGDEMMLQLIKTNASLERKTNKISLCQLNKWSNVKTSQGILGINNNFIIYLNLKFILLFLFQHKKSIGKCIGCQ
mgnify:CR=1 FL=1